MEKLEASPSLSWYESAGLVMAHRTLTAKSLLLTSRCPCFWAVPSPGPTLHSQINQVPWQPFNHSRTSHWQSYWYSLGTYDWIWTSKPKYSLSSASHEKGCSTFFCEESPLAPISHDKWTGFEGVQKCLFLELARPVLFVPDVSH